MHARDRDSHRSDLAVTLAQLVPGQQATIVKRCGDRCDRRGPSAAGRVGCQPVVGGAGGPRDRTYRLTI